MTKLDLVSECGIVRTGRWLSWGYRHGLRVRPSWLANLIVGTWNVVACRIGGHDWLPEVDWNDPESEPAFSPTAEFCPYCCATRNKEPRS